ncbi:3-isopropylmalate dehydratase large subunit [Sulfitobacter sp. S190]|uniref:3-isopropylmalate dehydratase large subunit n=1 Tax=Sulfitobacter sp. S190 TaxID=2867022 RepID=UPI0021A51BF7|nr:3-isopropylmalate dehydratase large subunit [Sulfitobacter sp. S190]UWR24293.1 3-isopropylmalate dehydratase large subunit [Sulfitobacter sp. S190]
MKTLLDKLWDAHEITRRDDGTSLLWVDRHLVHEGSHHAFAKISARGASVAHPDLTFAVVDHYAPTRAGTVAADVRRMIDTLGDNARRAGIRLYGLRDPGQGIVHVIGPEQGITLPGLLINCGDSHTSTHGAFGALAFGVGATEVAHILATQTIWQKRPKSMQLWFDGTLTEGVTAKDLALHWIAKLGSDGARGHAIEYAGPAIRNLSMEGRLTLCNLSIEGGGRFGMIAPDEATFTYLKGRPFAPAGDAWDKAVEDWRQLCSDDTAEFDSQIRFDASDVAPTVTWGTSPEEAAPITDQVPRPDDLGPNKAEHARASLAYMGLEPGARLVDVPVDEVFIGSCTNGRIEDLRMAAKVLAGRKARVPGLVSPGSAQVKKQAEQEGLATIFSQAGLEWADAGCSMCVGMNGDIVGAGKRCASSTNRNFKGRQGRGARTHLMSAAMVAAAAVKGHLADVRPLLEGRE